MYTPRLKTKYSEEIVARLQEKYSYKSVMQVPKLEKICLNQGLGDAVTDKKMVEQACDEMTLITGQKAVATKSKKDISNFKLRKGMPIGARVTLRGDKMYEFLDRFITSSLPLYIHPKIDRKMLEGQSILISPLVDDSENPPRRSERKNGIVVTIARWAPIITGFTLGAMAFLSMGI